MSGRRQAEEGHPETEAAVPASSTAASADAAATPADRSAEPATPEALEGEPGAAGGPGASESAPGGEPAIDYKDRWLRAEAEFQNFRRRAQRDLEEGVRFAEERGLLEMISQLDDLERALQAAAEAGAPEPWLQGVKLVAQRMVEYLGRQGVTVVDPLGAGFDPEFHEALLEVDAPQGAAPGSVVQVVRKGYRRNGRALRAARVVVARRAPAEG